MKYLNLKKDLIIKGGAIMPNQSYQEFFDTNFTSFIQLVIGFNANPENIKNGTMFHIKGGANVKAKAIKYDKPNAGITNDIDILFINNHYKYIQLISTPYADKNFILQQNKIDASKKINDLFQLLQSRYPGTWTIDVTNNLHTIKCNNYGVFDITFYEREDMMSDFNYTLFGQSYNEIRLERGLPITTDPEEYIMNILTKQKTEPHNIEEYTLTDTYIERKIATKAIEKYAQHIQDIPIWKQKAENPELLRDYTGVINQQMWQNYVHQSTPEYIAKIQNKYNRYQIKLRLINEIEDIELFGSI
jgi:hypothetical protein